MDKHMEPVLYCEYSCSGTKTTFSQTLSGETLDDMLVAFRGFLLACGFSEDLVKEYLQTSMG